ncbi:unnamed protein product [Chrysoparadoxa australica]
MHHRHHQLVKNKVMLGSKHSHHVTKPGEIGRRHMRNTAGSFASAAILDKLRTPRQATCDLVLERLEQAGRQGTYLNSKQFGLDLLALCQQVQGILEQETRCLFLQSPCHVFGDIHGNLEDLHFFSDNIWSNGIRLTPGRFLFLGDYVDRGMYSLECVAYLFAMKIICPNKVFLLRGNHELRDVNSWEDYYQEGCFLWQCKNKFGLQRGQYIWEMINQTFDRLPLAAVIDNDVFCTHGGIPRPRPNMSQIASIMEVPNRAAVSPPYPTELADQTKVAYECLWSDPAKPHQESGMDAEGYGSNPRGSTAQCFGHTAVDDFLSNNDMSYIIRAHEKTREGITIGKNARVLTVFSTSKDHNLGDSAQSACILIDDGKIEVITKDCNYVGRAAAEEGAVGGAFAFPDEMLIQESISSQMVNIAIDEESELELGAPVLEDIAKGKKTQGRIAELDGSSSSSEAEPEEDRQSERETMVLDFDAGKENNSRLNNMDAMLADLEVKSMGKETLRLARFNETDLSKDVKAQKGKNEKIVKTTTTVADSAGATVSPATVPNSMNLDRRESMDVGVFTKLRAKGPQVGAN